jgi:hypothetical protein
MSGQTARLIGWLRAHMTCKSFARQVAGSEGPSGGLAERFHFWLHWFICPFCRRYWEELAALGEVQRARVSLSSHPAIRIPEIKTRLKENLRRKWA